MPIVSKYFLAEQVLYRLANGWPDVADAVQREDVYAAIEQKINAMLKIQHFNVTLASGETIPENLMIATYGPISVSEFGQKKSVALLPTMPISLPRNMGIFEVSPDEYFNDLYIPILSSQKNLLCSQDLINDLLDQVGFEVYSDKIVFTKNVKIDNVNNVYVRLLVMDLSKYDEYTALPLPADYGEIIVEELYKSFLPVELGQDDKVVDSYSNIKNQK